MNKQPPEHTALEALDGFAHVVRGYDYAKVLGGVKGYEMRCKRLEEIADAKRWVRQQMETQQGEREQ